MRPLSAKQEAGRQLSFIGLLHLSLVLLQVALLCGLDDTAKKAALNGPVEGGSHLHKLLKFLTVRSEVGDKRSGVTLLGGTVNPLVDGNPGRYCTWPLVGCTSV